MEDASEHDPSPDKIREMCRVIQDGWSESERRRRAPWAVVDCETIEILKENIVFYEP